MSDWLQTQLFGPYFNSSSAHNDSYEQSNESNLWKEKLSYSHQVGTLSR